MRCVLSVALHVRRDQTAQDQHVARLRICVRAATEEQPCCRKLSPAAEPAALRDFLVSFCFAQEFVPARGHISSCLTGHLSFKQGWDWEGQIQSITLGIRVNGVINVIQKNLLYMKMKSKHIYVMSCA